VIAKRPRIGIIRARKKNRIDGASDNTISPGERQGKKKEEEEEKRKKREENKEERKRGGHSWDRTHRSRWMIGARRFFRQSSASADSRVGGYASKDLRQTP